MKLVFLNKGSGDIYIIPKEPLCFGYNLDIFRISRFIALFFLILLALEPRFYSYYVLVITGEVFCLNK